MKSPEEIEKALQRLMPPAMSGQGHAAVIESIERLAVSNESAAEVGPALGHPAFLKKYPLDLGGGGCRGSGRWLVIFAPRHSAVVTTGHHADLNCFWHERTDFHRPHVAH